MPLYESRYSHYREDLTKYLVQIPCLQDTNRREDVVCDLPQYIQDNISRRTTLSDAVRNIVTMCSCMDGIILNETILVKGLD